MRTPEQQKWIDEAIRRGIVPGATIKDAYGDEGVVPPVDEWHIHGVSGDMGVEFRADEKCVCVFSRPRTSWATVITPAPPSMNDRVKDVLSRHPGAKEALKELFPDAFPDEPFEFGREYQLYDDWREGPLYVGWGAAPDGLEYKCLIVARDYEMRTQEHGGRTVLTFHKKR